MMQLGLCQSEIVRVNFSELGSVGVNFSKVRSIVVIQGQLESSKVYTVSTIEVWKPISTLQMVASSATSSVVKLAFTVQG